MFANLTKSIKSKPHIDILYSHYEKSSSLKELCAHLKDYDCSIYRHWVDDIFLSNMQLSMQNVEWKIDISNENELTIQIIKVEEKPKGVFSIKGGSQYTIKQSFLDHPNS